MEFLPAEIKHKKILISPLDWGMGHSCRCVSVIRQLMRQENNLTFAGNESQLDFISKEFPTIKTTYLDGYNVTLDSERSTYWQMLSQSFKINGAASREHKWLKEYISQNGIDMIISDNRYGLYHENVTSIILTHQLSLQIPRLAGLTSELLQKKINKFDGCWIPDDDQNLSGDLSKAVLKIPTRRIGLLNRFNRVEVDEDLDILVILSGPEPSRSTFENQCLDYLKKEGYGSAAIVGTKDVDIDNYECHSNPTTVELETLIGRSKRILSRAGYTTIMELVSLQKNAILVPTKGQFEQEYLAQHINLPFIEFRTEGEIF